MSKTRLPSLAELKRRPAARSKSDTGTDDASLFQAAMEDVSILPASDHAEIRRAPPPPVPRPKSAKEVDAPLPAKSARDESLPAHWFSEIADAQSPEEQLLARALQGVVPIQSDRVTHEPIKPHPIPLQHELDEQAALEESIYAPTPLDLVLEGGDELHYLKDGMPRSLLRDLRRGRWVVEAQLDLHGANRDEARDLLAAAFAGWRKRDVRCVRIIHGKGLGSPGKEPVLKKLVAGWLMNYDDVLAYAQARVHDGGAGALIVLMRATRR